MSATNAPFGLRVVSHPSGVIHAVERSIASAYAANIFFGDVVKLLTTGVIALATSDGTRAGTVDGISALGVFAGCTYVDATGRPVTSNMWPTGQVATDIKAYVYEDPDLIFVGQANGSVAAAAVGDQADWVGFAAPGGNVATGVSTSGLNSTLVGAGQQGQFRIIGFDETPDNAPGDSFTRVKVQFAEHQFRAKAVAV